MPTVQRSGVGRYVQVLRIPGALTVTFGGTLARLPIGMTALALLLLVQSETGSFGLGGAVSGAFSAALALAAPMRGTSVDRRGGRAVLVRYGLAHPAALACCLAAAVSDVHPALLLASAAVAGATFPPVGAVIRSLLGVLYEDEADRTTAYALDSVLLELAFVSGPLVVGLAVAVASPAAAVMLAAVLVAVGSVGLGRAAVTGRLRPQESGSRVPISAPLRSSPVRLLLAALLVLGVAFGATEVAVAAYGVDAGAGHVVGVLLSLWAAGSAVGGLFYGSRVWSMPARRQYPWLLGLLAAGLSLPLASFNTWSLGVLLFVGGAAIAPFSACNMALLAGAAPRGATAATFAWSGSAIVAGIAVGTSSAGWVVDHWSSRAGFVLAAAAGLVALALGLGGRRAREPRHDAVAAGERMEA